MPKLELVIQKRPRAWILTEKLLTVWRVINWFTTGLLLQVEASPYQHYCKEQYPWCCASYSGTMKGPMLYSATLKVKVGYRRDQAFGFHTILGRVGFLSMKIVPLRWGGANQWWHGEQSQVTWLEAKKTEKTYTPDRLVQHMEGHQWIVRSIDWACHRCCCHPSVIGTSRPLLGGYAMHTTIHYAVVFAKPSVDACQHDLSTLTGWFSLCMRQPHATLTAYPSMKPKPCLIDICRLIKTSRSIWSPVRLQ